MSYFPKTSSRLVVHHFARSVCIYELWATEMAGLVEARVGDNVVFVSRGTVTASSPSSGVEGSKHEDIVANAWKQISSNLNG
jgi:hypothetical protein